MRCLILIFVVLFPVSAACQGLDLFDAPAWAHYFCDSSEPDPNGGLSGIQGVHCYPSLTIPSGKTVTVTNLDATTTDSPNQPRGEWLVYVDGDCTIAGTIKASALNLTWADSGASGGGGGSGGGSTGTAGVAGYPTNGFGAGPSLITMRPTMAPDLNQIHVAAGGTGGTGGAGGAAGSTPSLSSRKWTGLTADQLVLGGSGGGAGGAGSSAGGLGGAGGGGVILLCADSIRFTGTIDVSGASGKAGVSGSSPSGGGGGGGGGVVLMASAEYLANSGSIVVNGGAGGTALAGSGSGGAGGNGWSKQFTLNGEAGTPTPTATATPTPTPTTTPTVTASPTRASAHRHTDADTNDHSHYNRKPDRHSHPDGNPNHYGDADADPHSNANADADAVLAFRPNPVAFGTVTSGRTRTLTLQVANTSRAPANIQSVIASGPPFTAVNQCPATLAANAICNVSVTFAPTSVGAQSGTVTFTDNASGSPQIVSLTGTGG